MTALLCLLLFGISLEEWIERLEHPDIAVRDEASRRLEEWEAKIEPRLERELKAARDPEVRGRLRDILEVRKTRVLSRVMVFVILGGNVLRGYSNQALDKDVTKISLSSARSSGKSSVHLFPDGAGGTGLLFSLHQINGSPDVKLNRIERLEGEAFICVLQDDKGIHWKTTDPPLRVLFSVIRREIQRPAGNGTPAVFSLLARHRGFRSLIPDLEKRRKETKDPFVRRVCTKAIQFQRGQK